MITIDQPCVYRIQIGDRFYYGSTLNFPKRKGDHLRRLKKGAHENNIMQRSWNKYQEVSIDIVNPVPEFGSPKEIEDNVRAKEQMYLDHYWGEELCMNLARRVENGMAGRKHTEEAKKKIGAAQKGKTISDEVRANMSAGQKGRKHTDEARTKMRASKKGNKNASNGGVIATHNDTGEALTFSTAKEAGAYFGVFQTSASNWCRGHTKPTKGQARNYTFKYADDNK